MNYRRRLISSAAILVAAALVLFLPHLISAPALIPLFAKHLLPFFSGQLEVQSCSLRWSGGLSCEGVQFIDDRHALRLQLPRISTDKGLFTLLVAPQYLGEVTLNQPTLTFLQPNNNASKGGDENTPSLKELGQQVPTSWWEQRSLRLKLQGGRILADQGSGNGLRVLARELRLNGDLASGTVNYVLDFQSGQAEGQFHTQGFLNLPIASQPFFPSLVSQATFDVRSMEIEPMLALAASRFPDVPQGRGTLNGACHLYMAGIDNIEVKGLTSLDDLELTGGVLGEDHPRLHQARLKFEGSKNQAEGWHLSQLELQSEPLSFSAQGLLDRKHIDFNGRGEADLAQLTTALPHLLAIHEQTSIHQGMLTFAFKAKGDMDRVNLQADCDTKRLEITQAGRPYAWENPLSLHAVATLSPVEVHFSHLHFQAPFLTVEGQGGSEDFVLNATADLDHLFAELDKIFALNLHAGGQGRLTLDSSRVDPDQLRLTTQLTIDNFGVDFAGQSLVPVYPFSLRGELVGKPWFSLRSGLQSLHLAAMGWPGEFHLDANPVQDGSEHKGAETENCRISTALDLQRLAHIFRTVRGWKSALQVQGQLQMDLGGEWRQAQLQLRQLTGAVKNFVLTSNGKTMIREPRITLGLEHSPLHLGTLNLGQLQVIQGTKVIGTPASAFCRIDLQPFVLDVQHLRLRAPEKIIDVQSLFGNRRNDQSRPVLEMHGLGNLTQLVPWWQQQGWLDDRLDGTGLATAALVLHPASADRLQSTEFSLRVKDLSIREGKKLLYDDPQMVLDLELQPGNKDGRTTKITRLAVQSSRFSFAGAGLSHNRKIPPLLDLQGELNPRAATVDQVLQFLVSGDVSVKDVKPGSILLSAPLHFPIDINEVTLSGQLPLEGLRYLGMSLPLTRVPIDLNRGALGVQINGESNGGQVSLSPKWQREGKKLILRFPPDSQVLSHLPITQAVTDGLLQQLPPFGCLLKATGTIGLKITRFSLPVSEKRRQADFAVVIDLEKARPIAVQALKQLLETAGFANIPLRFQERELICEGWNGAITCAPLRLKIGAQDLRISGSKRRSGQLAYKVELPVTESLTRKAGVAVYGNFNAVAEIAGTQKTPVFEQDTFFQELAGQITANLPQPLTDNRARAGASRNADAPTILPPVSN
ncbi:MAG: hypothetical protein AB7U29_14015 [Desulfobulbus sp.]